VPVSEVVQVSMTWCIAAVVNCVPSVSMPWRPIFQSAVVPIE
jgi:hypothetical protein